MWLGSMNPGLCDKSTAGPGRLPDAERRWEGGGRPVESWLEGWDAGMPT